MTFLNGINASDPDIEKAKNDAYMKWLDSIKAEFKEEFDPKDIIGKFLGFFFFLSILLISLKDFIYKNN